MRSADWWVECDEADAIRQGDVIRQRDATAQAPRWGLVVTADCDIAQRKADDRLSWLAVVPAAEYLRKRWAPDQLRRLLTRNMRPTAEELSGHMRRSNVALEPLTETSLGRWLETHAADAIWAIAVPDRIPDKKLLGRLTALRLASGHEGPADELARWRAVQSAMGRDTAAQNMAVRDAFGGERGFPDFFLLPDLPTGDDYGHVVLLRDISSIDASDVFVTEREARLTNRPDAFHRVARLHDGIRFAITQKLAFLFSRIGLPTAFENACASATELVAESAGLGEEV